MLRSIYVLPTFLSGNFVYKFTLTLSVVVFIAKTYPYWKQMGFQRGSTMTATNHDGHKIDHDSHNHDGHKRWPWRPQPWRA